MGFFKKYKHLKKVKKIICFSLIIGMIGIQSVPYTFADDTKTEGYTQVLDPDVEQQRDVEDIGELDLTQDPEIPSLGGEENETVTVLNQMRTFSTGPRAQRTEGIIEPNGSGQSTIKLYNESTGTAARTYISDGVLYSGVFPFYNKKNNRYQIKIAGAIGWVDASSFREYSFDEVKSMNMYKVNGENELVHYISRGATQTKAATIMLGPAPVTLRQGVNYYSPDGHYFYTNLKTMVADLKLNRHSGSLNASDPWYNYYQYLSNRAKSNVTKNELKSYLARKGYTAAPSPKTIEVKDLKSHESLLVGAEGYFVDEGYKYGINPLITFGTAINESGWGRSNIALKDKNIFGHEAYDSAPESATVYESVGVSIQSHMTHFLNWHYMDVKEANYYGGYLGDKQSGINVKYSSDPFWGEKAAEYFYILDWYIGMKDYNQYTIGLVTSSGTPSVYKEANSNSGSIYKLNVTDQHVLILDEVKKGSEVWYKIAADPLLSKNRDLLPWNTDTRPFKTVYDHNNNYGYVKGSEVKIVAGKNHKGATGKRGDVNGDGKISLLDLAMVKSHLLGNSKLTGDRFTRGDVNGDGKISLLDLAMIKSHLLGNSKLD